MSDSTDTLHSAMKIIPVIDLKAGEVVHAVRGERDRYRPVESCISKSSQPGDVAVAFARLGALEVYVADLDAIAGGEPNIAAYEAIVDAGPRLWLDAGIRNAEDADVITRSLGNDEALESLVIGSETLEKTAALRELLDSPTAPEITFSLDHRDGALIARISAWQDTSIVEIAREVVGYGVRRFVDLDLARVGNGDGPQGRGLPGEIPNVVHGSFVAIGGGVRSLQDIVQLDELGYDAALVATALHNGSISASEFQRLCATPD